MISTILVTFLLTLAFVGAILVYTRLKQKAVKPLKLVLDQDEIRRTRDEKMVEFKKYYDAYVSKYGDPAERVNRDS